MNRIFLFVLLLGMASAACSQNPDINVLKKINRWDSQFVKSFSKTVSNTTPYIAVGAPTAMAIYAAIDRNESLLKDAIYIGSSVGEAVVLSYGLKYAVDRERPYDRYPDKIEARTTESSASFPSAHAAAAFSLATSLSLRYPKWYVIAPSALWATSVGFARMNQGVHYPSDVLAGAVIGSGCAVANVYVNRWLNKWLFSEKKKAVVLNY